MTQLAEGQFEGEGMVQMDGQQPPVMSEDQQSRRRSAAVHRPHGRGPHLAIGLTNTTLGLQPDGPKQLARETRRLACEDRPPRVFALPHRNQTRHQEGSRTHHGRTQTSAWPESFPTTCGNVSHDCPVRNAGSFVGRSRAARRNPRLKPSAKRRRTRRWLPCANGPDAIKYRARHGISGRARLLVHKPDSACIRRVLRGRTPRLV